MFFERLFKINPDQSPVGLALFELEQQRRRSSWLEKDEYFIRLYSTLQIAKESGLTGNSALLSCWDFARTLCPDHSAEAEDKRLVWQNYHDLATRLPRPSRNLTMKLYPTYFAAIADGRKPYEGRAWDPLSDKNYADIRSGDKIVFTLDNQSPDFGNNCRYFGLSDNASMQVDVDEIYFAPSVHDMFCLGIPVGLEFQPDVHYCPADLIELGRAAVYYGLPNYPDRIDKYGFLGIKISHPTRIN